MSLKIKALIILLSMPFILSGQKYQPAFELDYGAKEIYFDDLGNVYTVDSTLRLRKYTSGGQLFGEYNNTLYGLPGSFDFTNSFQPLVFYPGIGKIVSLDANLSVVEEFFLRDLNLIDVGCISRSKDNHFWVYDNIDAKIKKIDASGRILSESLMISMYWDEDIQVIRIRDTGRNVIAMVESRGLLVFDLFGTLSQKLILDNINNFYISGSHLLIQYGNCDFSLYALPTKVEKSLELNLQSKEDTHCLTISSKNIGVVRPGVTVIYQLVQ